MLKGFKFDHKQEMPQKQGIFTLLFCVLGVYACFLTWALVQEPLSTRVWPESNQKFQAPSVIAIAQASVAMLVGGVYLKWRKLGYKPFDFIFDHGKELALISFTQSTSTPLASYSLHHVEYLTYMLAKSCKMIPILLVHLLLYKTSIPRKMKVLALVVSMGVVVFTVGGWKPKSIESGSGDRHGTKGYVLLLLSLFLDGMTNATQDNLLKSNKPKVNKSSKKKITGAHLMFALNMFIIIWNALYLKVLDRQQWEKAKVLLRKDPEILNYLFTYACCGAIGQCFIFYTLEKYGSLVLVMITVTRKMMSMILSIAVFGKRVNPIQWAGIIIVFGGITFEAIGKMKTKRLPSKSKLH